MEIVLVRPGLAASSTFTSATTSSSSEFSACFSSVAVAPLC